MNSAAFYHIAGLGSYSEQQGHPYPWTIDVDLPESAVDQLTNGQPIAWKVVPKLGKANRISSWSDFAATNVPTIIISDRAKLFLEEHAESDFQFIRIRVQTKVGRRIESPIFWVANCLHLLDCVDKRRSATDLVCGELVYKWVEIASSKVPNHIKAFRCDIEPQRLLVRGSLANAVLKAGLTGANFFATGRPGAEV